MAEKIDLRCDTTHEDGDAPAEKRARTLTLHNERVDCADSASTAKSPIAIRPDERGAMTAPAAPADAAPVLAPPTVPPPGTRVAVRYDDEEYEGTVADALDEHSAMVKFDDGSEHPINFTEPGIRITREAPAVAPAPAPVAPPAAPADAAPVQRPKRRRPRRAVDLADAAAALDTETIKGWMRDRSAIVDVKRPRYDAVAAAPADPLAPRLAPSAAPELAAVVARLHGGDGASAREALSAWLATPRAFARRGTGYAPFVVCPRHRQGKSCELREECPADIHVLPGGGYATYDCIVRDDDGNIVVEDGRAKCVCGAKWTTRGGGNGVCSSAACGYEAGLKIVSRCASEGKPPPDYMYTYDRAQKALAAAAQEDADEQAAFEKTDVAKQLLREIRGGDGDGGLVIDEGSWNEPRAPPLSWAASDTCATSAFGVDAPLFAWAAPAAPCPMTATKPLFIARYEGAERASRHRTTTAAPTETRDVLNEGATYHTVYMETPTTLDKVLPAEDRTARGLAGVRGLRERMASEEQRLENSKKARHGEGLDYDMRCPRELDPKKYMYGCPKKNKQGSGCCRYWHAPNPPKGKQPIFMWDADQEEHVDYDESKWDEFCERCAAAKAAGAECVCKMC